MKHEKSIRTLKRQMPWHCIGYDLRFEDAFCQLWWIDCVNMMVNSSSFSCCKCYLI